MFERLGGEVDMRIYPAWGISSTGMSGSCQGDRAIGGRHSAARQQQRFLTADAGRWHLQSGMGERRHTLDAVSSILSSMAECAQCWCPGASHWKPA